MERGHPRPQSAALVFGCGRGRPRSREGRPNGTNPVGVENLPRKPLRKDERIAHYLGQFITMQVESVWKELGGAAFPAKKQAQAEPVRLKTKDLLTTNAK